MNLNIIPNPVVGSFINKKLSQINKKINSVNSSKIFAGIVVVTLNISSKYVNLKLSKSIESYLKHNFSRNIMVGAICWMGTRDIYTALILTSIFIILSDFLLNEDSMFCIMGEETKNNHKIMIECPSDSEIIAAKEVLQKVNKCKQTNKMKDPEGKGKAAMSMVQLMT